MAIEKKLSYNVSDATGERKVAKYYRIPLLVIPYHIIR